MKMIEIAISEHRDVLLDRYLLKPAWLHGPDVAPVIAQQPRYAGFAYLEELFQT